MNGEACVNRSLGVGPCLHNWSCLRSSCGVLYPLKPKIGGGVHTGVCCFHYVPCCCEYLHDPLRSCAYSEPNCLEGASMYSCAHVEWSEGSLFSPDRKRPFSSPQNYEEQMFQRHQKRFLPGCWCALLARTCIDCFEIVTSLFNNFLLSHSSSIYSVLITWKNVKKLVAWNPSCCKAGLLN